MTRHLVCVYFAAALLSIGVASAHHARSPVYDGARLVTVEGVVQEFRFVNPHSTMTLDVVDPSGKAVVWNVEFAGVLNLTRGGWTAETFKPGERVSVTGEPAHSGASAMYFRRAKRANGEDVLPPGAEEIEAIDALRRQRAQQREAQN
jgi:hypothetical protein